MSQIVLSAGCWNSFAGVMTLVYYDAESNEVVSVNAGFVVPRAETDPASIPAAPEPSGRTALVPGYFAGISDAHKRYGKLPWQECFAPAIWLAEEGFEIDDALSGMVKSKQEVLNRRESTRAIFIKENGEFYREGDHFRQPLLAITLRSVAEKGVQHIYSGPWAEAMVQAVREEGGKLTLRDLAQYEPLWSTPLQTSYGGEYELYTPNCLGGARLLEALNLFELAGLRERESYATSANSLYDAIQIARVGPLISSPKETQDDFVMSLFGSGTTHSHERRVSKEHASVLWEKLNDNKWQTELRKLLKAFGNHSDGIVAADSYGNVVAMLHTINTASWGSTGIFVDGISIPDAACKRQKQLAQVGAGNRVPTTTNPLLALKQGKPVLASACIGRGLHESSLLRIHNVLDHGLGPREAIDAPLFLSMDFNTYPQGERRLTHHVICEDDFSDGVFDGVEALGQPLTKVPRGDFSNSGFWVGITLDPSSGLKKGCTTDKCNGIVLAK